MIQIQIKEVKPKSSGYLVNMIRQERLGILEKYSNATPDVPKCRRATCRGNVSRRLFGPEGNDAGVGQAVSLRSPGQGGKGTDSFSDSPLNVSPYYKDPIQRSFHSLRKLTYGKELPADKDHYNEVLCNPESQFDKIIQRANEYIVGVETSIENFKEASARDLDLLDAENRIEKSICEVGKIATQLRRFIEETSARRVSDTAVSPRVLNAVKAREASVDELFENIKRAKKNMQTALKVRERHDLLGSYTRLDRDIRWVKRQRDAEEITSDSTERLLNSKRILLETVQASSGTLSSLASSSQSIVKNDQELQTQNYMVSTARSLLKKYGRRASTDKLLIWLGFIFFGFCALLVAYRRLL